jgi:hypothetical protein
MLYRGNAHLYGSRHGSIEDSGLRCYRLTLFACTKKVILPGFDVVEEAGQRDATALNIQVASARDLQLILVSNCYLYVQSC